MRSWIQTRTGLVFEFTARYNEIRATDIAHALSWINRFTGHARYGYSVCIHSICCAEVALPIWGPRVALGALVHDAHEAYVGDVASPLKSRLPAYRDLEAAIERDVQEQLVPGLDLSATERRAVKAIDLRMLLTEAAHLLEPPPEKWNIPATPFPAEVLKMQRFWRRWPRWQQRRWLKMYRSLCRRLEIEPLSE